MVRNILIVVLIVLLCYVAYVTYKHHTQTATLGSGDFSCQGCDTPEEHARFLKENSGETFDGDREHKRLPARIAAEDAAEGITPDDSRDPGHQYSTMQQPPAEDGYAVGTGHVTDTPPVVVPTREQPGATPAGIPPPFQHPYRGGPPTTDTVPPYPPNGERFAGSGSYQWYRQGNLTWRVDTVTGRSCIIYATMDEWRKPIVMSHGCGRNT